MLYIFKILLHKVPLQLRKRSRVQEFRRLFYENCQWRGVPRYVEMFFKYIVTPAPAKFCSWFLKNWNHLNWRVFSPAALYKGFLPCWLRMAPWSLTFWLSFEQVQQTPPIFYIILYVRLVIKSLICVLSDTSLLRGNCLVRAKKNQTKIKPSDLRFEFCNFSRLFSPIQRERDTPAWIRL